MALKAVVENLEAVPEALRGEYAEKDGKFYLSVDDLDNHHGVSGLKTALNSERGLNRAAKQQVARWEALGKSPDEIAELLAAVETENTDKLKKKGDFDAILNQHKTTWETEKKGLLTRAETAESFGKSAIIETNVMGALTKAKATPTGIELLTERFGKRINLEIADGKRTITIMQADGKTPMAGSGADGSATFDDLVKEAVKNYPELFEGTGSGGGGAPRNNSGGSGKTLTRAEWEALSPTDQRAKHKDGFKIVN